MPEAVLRMDLDDEVDHHEFVPRIQPFRLL